jgi:hypothetical protein
MDLLVDTQAVEAKSDTRRSLHRVRVMAQWMTTTFAALYRHGCGPVHVHLSPHVSVVGEVLPATCYSGLIKHDQEEQQR